MNLIFSLNSLIVYFFLVNECNILIENDAWFELESRCERNVIISIYTMSKCNDDEWRQKYFKISYEMWWRY